MTVLWVAQAVTVTNGQKEVIVTSAPGNAITKVETSATFHGVGFSLPYEIERTYNNGTNDVIVLHENWAGSSGSIAAVAVPSGAAVTRAANNLEELKSVYEAIADSVSTTVTANSIPQRDNNGRMKAAPASASDDVVVKSQTGTAFDKTVTTSNDDTTAGRLLKVGDAGILTHTPPIPGSIDDLFLPMPYIGFGGAHQNATTGDNPFPDYNGAFSLQVIKAFSLSTLDFATQLAIKISSGNASLHSIDAKFRTISGDANGWTPWMILQHSGNANFTVFGGNGADDRVAKATGRGSTTAFLELHLNSPTPPTGVIVTGTFRLVDSVGTTTLVNGLGQSSFSLSNAKPSSKLFTVLLSFASASVSKDLPMYLETDSTDAKIEVTF